jgi:hypothetical protein
MLFNEVYSSYFNVVASVLKEAVTGTLTDKRLTEIVHKKAFAESILTIPALLKSKKWPLLSDSLRTPVKHTPTMPLTVLQKRWLKALLNDPRIKLFSPPGEGLEDVEPLYSQDTLVFFDRYSDCDPYDDSQYREHFKTILTALREGKRLHIRFNGHMGTKHSWICIPYRLEYSSKDDKFRLITASPRNALTVNLARIRSCELLDAYSHDEYQPPKPRTETLTLELTDERNALERAMLHFSDLEKRTERLDNNHYRITLRYEREDMTELLIRVLSFGPMLRVISPECFIDKIRERLEKQTNCGL